MTSPVHIANLALGWLGKNPILGFDDPTTEATLVSQNYPLSRDAVLSSAEFSFATKRYVLNPDPNGLAFGDENRFLLPKEVLRVFSVNQRSGELQNGLVSGVPWRVEGRYILSVDQQVRVRAAVQINDTSVFSPEITRAIAARLAADIAIPLTESIKIMDSMERRYLMYLSNAKSQDGRQGSSRRLRSEWLRRARWSGGGGFFGPTV